MTALLLYDTRAHVPLYKLKHIKYILKSKTIYTLKTNEIFTEDDKKYLEQSIIHNVIDFEKKVASFSDKELANIVGILINSNLSKTPAVAASQKYKNTVEVLKKEILNDFPQLKYREFITYCDV